MKNIKIFILSFVCLICILLNTSCSCSRPISVKYKVNVEGDAASYVSVDVVMYQKFREPMDTPCYKKMEKGYVKLETNWEIQSCVDSECYKKVDGEYVLIEDPVDLVRCLDGNQTCYENVTEEYYKLIEDSEGISECYDSQGQKFERTTYSKKEKKQLSKTTIINNNSESLNYESEYKKLSTEKTYSYLYEFTIKNNGEQNIKINQITYENIVNNSLVEESKNKVIVKTSYNADAVLEKNATYTVTVEVKYLTKDDISSEITKDLELNIPVVANIA